MLYYTFNHSSDILFLQAAFSRFWPSALPVLLILLVSCHPGSGMTQSPENKQKCPALGLMPSNRAADGQYCSSTSYRRHCTGQSDPSPPLPSHTSLELGYSTGSLPTSVRSAFRNSVHHRTSSCLSTQKQSSSPRCRPHLSLIWSQRFAPLPTFLLPT